MKNKGKLTGLYDLSGKELNTKMHDTLLEQQMYKESKMMSGKMCKTNKEKFEEHYKCFDDCIRYNPCPICNKCLDKASHLYEKCGECLIPRCLHKFKDKNFMIKRKNFKIKPNKEIIDMIKKLEGVKE